jgi:hypothetical protein
LNNAVTDCFNGRLCSVSNVKLMKERFDVGFHGFLGEVEIASDFLISSAIDNESQDFEFSGRKVFQLRPLA